MDRSRLAVGAAIPGAIGYALPLVAGLIAGRVADGVAASAGALIVGFANLGGRYALRAETLLVTALAVAIAALVGGLAGPSAVATVALIGAWGFAGGLLVSFGTRAAFVGMLSTWAVLLAGDLNLHGQAVLHEAWLMTAGGLAQTLIAIAAWPLRPFSVERRAVADAYRALAGYARAPHADALPWTAAALGKAAESVGAGPALPGERGALRTLVEQGEWIRLELAGMNRSQGPAVDATLKATADALDVIAAAGNPDTSLARLRQRAQEIDEPAASQRAATLVAWVTAAARESRAGAPGPAPKSHAIADLRSQLTLRSSAFRHATRLSLALIVAAMVYRSLSLGSGYWVPLTVLFVLKPDYGTTHARALGRSAGTVVGVTIAWAIVTAFSPSSGEIVAVLALLAFLAYALFPANYALFSIVLTVLIALVVEFSGGSPVGALIDRIIDTAAGTAIALGAFALWPTRQAPHTRQALAAYTIAEARWIDAILNAYTGDSKTASIRSNRLAARRARTEALDAVRRASAEPRHRRPDVRRFEHLLFTIDQISDSALVLAADVHDGARAPSPTVTAYRETLNAHLNHIATTLRSDVPPAPMWCGTTMPQRPPDGVSSRTLAAETARILAALNELERTWQANSHDPSEPAPTSQPPA